MGRSLAKQRKLTVCATPQQSLRLALNITLVIESGRDDQRLAQSATLGTWAKTRIVANNPVARFAGWAIQWDAFLGLRLRLHPRLYATARVRGLKSCESLGKDKRSRTGLISGARAGTYSEVHFLKFSSEHCLAFPCHSGISILKRKPTITPHK